MKKWTEETILEATKGCWFADENIFTAMVTTEDGDLMFRYIPPSENFDQRPVFVVRQLNKDNGKWLMLQMIRADKPTEWNPLNA